MVDSYSSELLFATPLVRITVADAAALNTALLAEAERQRVQSPGVQKSNRGGWHSEGNLFDGPAACVAQLRDIAVDAVRSATRQVSPKLNLESLDMKLFGWMNVNPAGGFNAPHTHPGAHWSGVYYVSQPEVEEGNSGMIEFLDPRTDLPQMRILEAPAFRLKKKLRPQPGDIVLFPSYLVHWVYPNETEEERMSIAFNATFKKKKKRK